MGKKLTFWLVVIVAVCALLAGGCGPTQQWAPNTGATLTVIAGEPDGPAKATAEAIALAQFGTAAALDVQARQAALGATAQAAAAAATLEAQRAQADVARIVSTRQSAAATSQANDRAIQATAQAHSTRVALEVAATAQTAALQATAQQRDYEATATAEAWNRQATATAQTKVDASTATAEAVAWAATVQYQAWEDRTTATAEVVQATQNSYSATATRAFQEREERLGTVRDYGLPLILFLLVCGILTVLVLGLIQYSKRPIIFPRSILGDAQPMGVPIKGGGFQLVDIDRQPGPVLRLLPGGQVDAPLLRSAASEERTTARDQLVDMVARPKLGQGHKGGEPPALPLAPPPTAPAPGLRSVRVLRQLGQAERAGFLPPPLIEALAADWEEEQ